MATSGERRAHRLELHGFAFGLVNLLLIVIWAATSRGAFWPVWPLAALGAILSVHAWVEAVGWRSDLVRRAGVTRAFAVSAGAAAVTFLFLVVVWADGSRGSFWPVWPLLGLAAVVGAYATLSFARRGRRRISELESTRAGAVRQQDVDLRRIERDLHDGAQARLVALGMSLGMAEQKLASDPDAAQRLLAEARLGAQEALEELRDLARGIHPPVLADRGLAAAVEALADRTPLPVDVAFTVDRTLARTNESAAYFVVAEALANAGKHAHASRVAIRGLVEGTSLVLEITDDGRGGADPSGSGLSGLARRVAALDGTLEVRSPAGGPTTIRVVMPCGS